MAEWDGYKINLPEAGARQDGVSILTEINHVVHPTAARRILEDGKIRPGIVYDESKMNKTRHAVVWMSANTWNKGSIYGTVQFTFPWKKLIEGKRFYWVEAMSYSNPAYRLLVSDRDVSALPFLIPYWPATSQGPLREKNGAWFWNSKYTSEFMMDFDLDLSDCTSFKGIAHKKDGCRLYGRHCRELDVLHFLTSGRMLAFLIGSGNHAVDPSLRADPHERSRPLSSDFDNAVSGLWFALADHKGACFGGRIEKPEESQAILRGALALHGCDRSDDARSLVSLLKDKATFQTALEALVGDHFGISGWQLPS